MSKDNIFKSFSDLQVYSLNSKRLAPTKKFDSYGPDNDKVWKCDISFSDNAGIQRVVSATANKKDLSESLAVMKVARFFNDEKKTTTVEPDKLRKYAILNSINTKLDAILQLLDPHSVITSHLLMSGDVELNPGPSVACDCTNVLMDNNKIDLDPMYPEDIANLEETIFNINYANHLSLESIKDYVCELTYYQTYFAIPDELLERLKVSQNHLSILAHDRHVHNNYYQSKLLQSGDVEMNPGPKQSLNKEVKKVEKAVKRVEKKMKIPLKNPIPKTKGNVRRARDLGINKAVRVRNNIDINYVKAVEAISLPAIDSNFRWPSQFTSEPTGIANVFERPDVGFSKGGALAPDSPFPTTDAYAVIQKVPECATIVFDQNPALSAWAYDFTFKGGSFGNPSTYATTGLMQLSDDDYRPLKLIQGTVSTPYAPHTNHWFAARHDDEPDLRFVWMNKNDLFQAVLTNNAATATTFKWKVIVADADGVPVDTDLGPSAAIGAGLPWTATHVANKDGYYAFVFGASQDLNAAFASVNVSGEGYVFCHRAMPSFDTNLPKIDSNRILGAAIMATENASVTNMQGKIRIAQVPKDRNWYDYVGKFDEFSGLKGSEKFDAITGVYGFIKPTSQADFEFRSYHSTNGNTITDSFWPIKLDTASASEKIIVYIRITNPDGQDMYWTFAFALEYRSNDQFVALGVSSIDVAAANRALEVLKHMQQFHENPLHVSDIVKAMKAGLRSTVNGVIKYTPKVMKVVKDYGPTALKLATSLASVL